MSARHAFLAELKRRNAYHAGAPCSAAVYALPATTTAMVLPFNGSPSKRCDAMERLRTMRKLMHVNDTDRR